MGISLTVLIHFRQQSSVVLIRVFTNFRMVMYASFLGLPRLALYIPQRRPRYAFINRDKMRSPWNLRNAQENKQ